MLLTELLFLLCVQVVTEKDFKDAQMLLFMYLWDAIWTFSYTSKVHRWAVSFEGKIQFLRGNQSDSKLPLVRGNTLTCSQEATEKPLQEDQVRSHFKEIKDTCGLCSTPQHMYLGELFPAHHAHVWFRCAHQEYRGNHISFEDEVQFLPCTTYKVGTEWMFIYYMFLKRNP